MLNVNQYFDGKVASIGLETKDLPATVGVMVPGEYTFGTEKREYMTVISGALTVKLPDESEWNEFTEGETFIVEANKSFDLKVAIDTAYLCKYE